MSGTTWARAGRLAAMTAVFTVIVTNCVACAPSAPSTISPSPAPVTTVQPAQCQADWVAQVAKTNTVDTGDAPASCAGIDPTTLAGIAAWVWSASITVTRS